MTPAALIGDLQGIGARLIRHGDRLRIESPGPIPEGLRDELVAHKPMLMTYVRLRELADAEGIDPAHVAALTAADLEDCVGESDDFLRSYLAALADSALRNRGHVPEGATAAALCAHCGPIWLHPSVAAVAPVVAGWPRVLGCPWCHVANAAAIPRPSVTCGACRHFMRDTVNPAEGIGRCARGVTPRSEESALYPRAQRRCAQFRA